ncbi:beta-galactosidase [Paenibacillus agaridevorans]|uniref:Beta-mannosidase n=1 Tax=Paenibacillus agaridevorans TaxID=171404 RepID=A0A2R5EYV2_9BACL|nr:glycoside hydrolase family 2 protein [Paenibacillus agaridevorans]GBG11717.1 beta-galactosidase [Paenibacillus agaridevorans]
MNRSVTTSQVGQETVQTALKDWKFKACRESEWLQAVVPGCVHTDLRRNGIIEDPFYATNEHDLQWIDKLDWEYETVFDLTEDLLAMSVLELVFDGLDTYADVTFNGKLILSVNNMFRSWRADVKGLAKPSGNQLHIRFRSPVTEDLPKIERLGYNLPASNDQSELGGLGEDKISVFARKAPYHYGWDWGPRFVTSGIWREVRVVGWNDIRVNDVFVNQEQISAEAAKLTVEVELESVRGAEGSVKITAGGAEWSLAVNLQLGVTVVKVPVEIAEPKLWWSRGLGEAHLYHFRATFTEAGSSEPIAEKAVRTGLRSVRLVREKDEAGGTFYFELNGVPVFAKGANHIPNDSFLTEITEERYRHEIASAAESNMNMLRIWGGGIYEQPAFYELCDEYGIMVWQDFMFACSMYPWDEPFLESVKLEARENVKKLRNHPSIVLWCGNNEIDSAWSQYDETGGWGWKQSYTAEQRGDIWAGYESIFHRILPEVVNELAPGADYWPSSPMIDLTGDIGQHAHPLSTEGDIHYWGVWHSVEPFENYNVKVGRFMSEYGFQSFPEYDSVRTFAEEVDMELESKVMLAHQKNGNGNRLIKEYMDIYMNEPKDFPSFLYMSQVLQAEAMKTAIEAHRKRMPYCMGTLYWQMNDCWPVASWAGMDYYGKWKALQYYAKTSFADTILSFDRSEGGELRVYAISDSLTPAEGELRLTLHAFDGEILAQETLEATVGANTSTLVYAADEAKWLDGRDAGSIVLVAELVQGYVTISRKEHYFAYAKGLKLGAAAVVVTEVEGSGGTCFLVSSNVLAKQVWLRAEREGRFSDNFFDVVPGKPIEVEFQHRAPGQAFSVPAAAGLVTVTSMIDYLA